MQTFQATVSLCKCQGKATVPSHFLTHDDFSAEVKHFNYVRISLIDNVGYVQI